MKLSILTATYNRGKYLNRIYDSIKENLKSGIEPEWIIIDDGSIDNTKNVVKEIKKEAVFEIKYIWQENMGKMKAINNGIKSAEGELIIDCDSDDYFVQNSFKTICENAEFMFSKEDIYAMCFLKRNTNRNNKWK